MCENCGPTPDDTKQAFAEFEGALNKLREHLGDQGVLVDWVVVTASSVIHEHIDSSSLGWTSRINQPMYRTRGLLEETLDGFRNDTVLLHLHHMDE